MFADTSTHGGLVEGPTTGYLGANDPSGLIGEGALVIAQVAQLQTQINSKADLSQTTAALATKSDAAQTTAALATKADAVVAIGECGLDYYYNHSDRAVQRDIFAAQIALAHQHKLPLVIHTREAWDETFEILNSCGVPDRTIFHCFTGSPVEAKKCLDIGAYLSFSGIVTFKKAQEIRDAAKVCSADKMLVETDSPFLAPVPHRGKSNQPAFLVEVGACLAEVRNVSVEEIARQTTQNATIAFPGIAA